MKHSRCTGFTLIELIAVIVVLAILGGVAIPKYIDYGNKAKEASDKASISAIQTALNTAYTQHRLNDSPKNQWVLWVGAIKNVMESGELPNGIEQGITQKGWKLKDQRGNTYSFTQETATSPATITKDAAGAPGFSI